MKKISFKISVVTKVIEALLKNNAYKAVAYVDEKLKIQASRKLFKGKLSDKKGSLEILLTIGKPNYQQREFVKQCKKADEPFPVKKIQLKFPPKKR